MILVYLVALHCQRFGNILHILWRQSIYFHISMVKVPTLFQNKMEALPHHPNLHNVRPHPKNYLVISIDYVHFQDLGH